jgi:hypothetical protein
MRGILENLNRDSFPRVKTLSPSAIGTVLSDKSSLNVQISLINSVKSS